MRGSRNHAVAQLCEVYTEMNADILENSEWFAIRSRQDFKAEKVLGPFCDEVFFPKESVSEPGKQAKEKALIPRVLFIRTTRSNALFLEKEGREHPEVSVPFWIYRYPGSNEIQVIQQNAIDLLRMLTSDSNARCEVFTKEGFRENERVRVTGGIYKGCEGYVRRVRKNRHVIVRIEGICMIMLPFIHPDLLERIG